MSREQILELAIEADRSDQTGLASMLYGVAGDMNHRNVGGGFYYECHGAAKDEDTAATFLNMVEKGEHLAGMVGGVTPFPKPEQMEVAR